MILNQILMNKGERFCFEITINLQSAGCGRLGTAGYYPALFPLLCCRYADQNNLLLDVVIGKTVLFCNKL